MYYEPALAYNAHRCARLLEANRAELTDICPRLLSVRGGSSAVDELSRYEASDKGRPSYGE